MSVLKTLSCIWAGTNFSLWWCSSVLPVPFAFSRMGVLLGVLTMAVVAYSNSLTSVLLLRAAGLTGHDSYEGVAQAVGGRAWKARSPLTYLSTIPSLLCLSFIADPPMMCVTMHV